MVRAFGVSICIDVVRAVSENADMIRVLQHCLSRARVANSHEEGPDSVRCANRDIIVWRWEV